MRLSGSYAELEVWCDLTRRNVDLCDISGSYAELVVWHDLKEECGAMRSNVTLLGVMRS
jgi:hypothetical protein